MSGSGAVRIWDPFIRLCHWTFVAGFTLNYFIVEPGRLVHQVTGYVVFSLVVLRIIWGTISKGYAGFRHFHLSSGALREHKHHLMNGTIPKDSGHNPLGWLMVFAVLVLFAGLGVTGFMLEEIDAFFGNDILESIHELMANTLFVLACIHIAAVFFTQWKGKIALIRPMITGTRR